MNGSRPTEILAPGGSLDHALWALEGGADAVYVGFQKFSARSHADNLTLDDMAALTAVAKEKGARVYCAVNILLDDEEVAEAVALAWQLHFRGVYALIVQDLGLALALRRHGPPLALHASTQAAVHNAGGVAALKQMGFCRVVLARELTMKEIGHIVAADPSMEYEVFVHGALCYSVSGNCMASGLMLGRSANRGDCGQVCRTKFELDSLVGGPPRHSGTFASMNDLELGARIRELRDLGVRSFKIEGRMKPPAYSYNTARAYRAFLDGGNDAQARQWLDEARMRYGRLPSAGWFDGPKALAQTNPRWAGTLGLPLGVVSGQGERSVKIATGSHSSVLKSLDRGDGVMVLGTAPDQVFRGALAGKTTVSGPQTELALADKVGFDARQGTLWLVSRHDGKLPVKRTGKVWRHPVAMTLLIEPAGAGAARFSLTSPDFAGLSLVETLPADQAKGDRRLEDSVSEIWHASDSPFGPGTWKIENTAGPLFVQPKRLKELRRRWYALIEEGVAAFVEGVTAAVNKAPQRGKAGDVAPLRGGLSPLQGVNKRVGFLVEWRNLSTEQLAATPWGFALPLAPFTPNEEAAYRQLRDFLSQLREAGTVGVFPGLSNPGHLTWIKRLRGEGFELPAWFADWGFHAANAWVPAQLEQALPGLTFVIPWLEDKACTDKSYLPPLFTSRACLLRNSFGGPTPQCPAGCPGHFSETLRQGKRRFQLEVRDCVNYLLAQTEPRSEEPEPGPEPETAYRAAKPGIGVPPAPEALGRGGR